MKKDFIETNVDSGNPGSVNVETFAAPNVNMQPRSTTLTVGASGDLTKAIIANQLGLFMFGVRYRPNSSSPWLFLGGNGTIGINSSGLLMMSINIDLTITATEFTPTAIMTPETYSLLTSAGYSIYKTVNTGTRAKMTPTTMSDFPRLQLLMSAPAMKGNDVLFELYDGSTFTPIIQIGIQKTYIID